eukprot:SM000163S02303  [mRNA]  locus=s163:25881:27232:- [translate_table: standard]
MKPLDHPTSWNARTKGLKCNVGVDQRLLLKSLVPIEAMIGAGALVAAFLPRFIGALLAVILLLPPLVRVAIRQLRHPRSREMEGVLKGRMTAELDGDFCIFLIGFRINAPWKLTPELQWAGGQFQAMIDELKSLPESSGFMGCHGLSGDNWVKGPQVFNISYWRSFDQLLAYSRDSNLLHSPAWKILSKAAKGKAEVGFWHEAYKVSGGQHESIYVNCPPMLLGRAGRLVPAAGPMKTSKGRMDGSEHDWPKEAQFANEDYDESEAKAPSSCPFK